MITIHGYHVIYRSIAAHSSCASIRDSAEGGSDLRDCGRRTDGAGVLPDEGKTFELPCIYSSRSYIHGGIAQMYCDMHLHSHGYLKNRVIKEMSSWRRGDGIGVLPDESF